MYLVAETVVEVLQGHVEPRVRDYHHSNDNVRTPASLALIGLVLLHKLGPYNMNVSEGLLMFSSRARCGDVWFMFESRRFELNSLEKYFT